MAFSKPQSVSGLPLRRHLAALLLLTVLWGVSNWRLLTPVTVDQWSINTGDFSDQMFTFSSYQAERLSAGQIPAWWPRNNGGQPFIADPQMAAFYPVRLAAIAYSNVFGGGHWTYADLQAEAIISLLLAGLFTYGAAFAISQSYLGAFAAGVILSASGLLTGYPIQQLPILESFIWLPLAILALSFTDNSRVKRAGGWIPDLHRWRWLALAGAAIGMSYLAGHVQTVLMIVYVTLAYWGYIVYSNKLSIFAWIGGALIIGMVAVGLSAVQLLPGLEFMALSTRNDALNFAAKAGGLTFGSLLQTIWPGIVSYFSPLYIGIASWAAIAVGVTVRDSINRFWSGVALITGILSFGGGTIAFTFAYWLLPGLSLFRDQERFALITVFALAMLAALGIKLIVRGTLTGIVIKRLRGASIIVAALTGVVLLGLSLWTFGGGAGNPGSHLDTATYAFMMSLITLMVIYQMRTILVPPPVPVPPSPASPPPATGGLFGQRPGGSAPPASRPPGFPPPSSSPPTPPAAPRPGSPFGSRPPTPPGDRPSFPFGSFLPEDRPSPYGNLPGKPADNRPNPFSRPPPPPDDRDLPPDDRPNPFRRSPIPPDDRNFPPDDRPNPFKPRSPIPPDDRDWSGEDRPSPFRPRPPTPNDPPPANPPRPFGSGSGSFGGSRPSQPSQPTSPFGSRSTGTPGGNQPPNPPPRPAFGSGAGSASGSSSGFGSRFGAGASGSGTSRGDLRSDGLPITSSLPFRTAKPPPTPVRIGAGVALVVLIAFDLLTWSNNNTPSVSAGSADQQIKASAYITPIVADHTDLGAWRVDGARALTPRASQYGLSDVFGASPLQLSSISALTRLPVDRYWDLFAVRYVISGSETLPASSLILDPNPAGTDAQGKFFVHQLTNPRPYAWLVYAADVNPSPAFARQILADLRFPLRDKAMLAADPPIPLSGARPADASARLTEFTPERIAVTVSTSANALLTLALPYYPGWQATIDGASTPILQNYTALSAVAVPAGEHTIALQFVPRPAIIGGLLSLITLAGLIAMLVRWRQSKG